MAHALGSPRRLHNSAEWCMLVDAAPKCTIYVIVCPSVIGLFIEYGFGKHGPIV